MYGINKCPPLPSKYTNTSSFLLPWWHTPDALGFGTGLGGLRYINLDMVTRTRSKLPSRAHRKQFQTVYYRRPPKIHDLRGTRSVAGYMKEQRPDPCSYYSLDREQVRQRSRQETSHKFHHREVSSKPSFNWGPSSEEWESNLSWVGKAPRYFDGRGEVDPLETLEFFSRIGVNIEIKPEKDEPKKDD